MISTIFILLDPFGMTCLFPEFLFFQLYLFHSHFLIFPFSYLFLSSPSFVSILGCPPFAKAIASFASSSTACRAVARHWGSCRSSCGRKGGLFGSPCGKGLGGWWLEIYGGFHRFPVMGDMNGYDGYEGGSKPSILCLVFHEINHQVPNYGYPHTVWVATLGTIWLGTTPGKMRNVPRMILSHELWSILMVNNH